MSVSVRSVRAKFFCKKVEVPDQSPKAGGHVLLQPVHSTDPRHENKAFWDGCPSGELTMYIANPETREFFVPGTEYYIDFIVAPATPV
jgi:hypothetical protein